MEVVVNPKEVGEREGEGGGGEAHQLVAFNVQFPQVPKVINEFRVKKTVYHDNAYTLLTLASPIISTHKLTLYTLSETA